MTLDQKNDILGFVLWFLLQLLYRPSYNEPPSLKILISRLRIAKPESEYVEKTSIMNVPPCLATYVNA